MPADPRIARGAVKAYARKKGLDWKEAIQELAERSGKTPDEFLAGLRIEPEIRAAPKKEGPLAPLQIPRRESFLEALKDPATTGGVIGSLIPWPLSIPMTGVMTAAGEAVGQIGQHTGLRKGRPPATTYEVLERMGEKAVPFMVADAVMGGALKVAGKFAHPFKTMPGAKEVIGELQPRMPSKFPWGKHPGLTPATATRSGVLDFFENTVQGSITGRPFMLKLLEEDMPKAMQGMIDDALEAIGPDASAYEMGKAITEMASGNFRVSASMAGTVYDEMAGVAKQAGGITIPTAGLKEFGEASAKEAEGILGKFGSEAAGDSIINDIRALPDEIDLMVAKNLRTRLRVLGDKFKIDQKDAPAIGMAQRATKVLHETIEETLGEQSPKALELFNLSRRMWAEAQETYNKPVIRRLIQLADVQGKAEDVIRTVFRGGNLDNIQAVKTALLEIPEGLKGEEARIAAAEGSTLWDKARRHYFSSRIRAAMRPTLGKSPEEMEAVITGEAAEAYDVNASSLFQGWFGKKALEGPTLQIISSVEERAGLRRVVDALMLQQMRQGAGTGKMWIQLKQAGLLTGLAAGGAGLLTGDVRTAGYVGAGTLGVLGLGPVVLAKILTNPLTAKWLAIGLEAPPGSRIAVSAFGKLAVAYRQQRRKELQKEPLELRQEPL